MPRGDKKYISELLKKINSYNAYADLFDMLSLNPENEIKNLQGKYKVDYERRIKELDDIMKGKVDTTKTETEKGVEIYEFEKQKIDEYIDIINKRNKLEAEKIGEQPVLLSDIRKVKPRVNKVNTLDTRQDVERYMASLRKQSSPSLIRRKSLIYKRNYIDTLKRAGMHKAAKVAEKFTGVELAEIYYDNPTIRISFIYLGDGATTSSKKGNNTVLTFSDYERENLIINELNRYKPNDKENEQN